MPEHSFPEELKSIMGTNIEPHLRHPLEIITPDMNKSAFALGNRKRDETGSVGRLRVRARKPHHGAQRPIPGADKRFCSFLILALSGPSRLHHKFFRWGGVSVRELGLEVGDKTQS
jgi:hypothetical protein